MLNEHQLFLINAGLDGELDVGERAELDQLLTGSEEARALQADLRSLAGALAEVPEQDCPVGLTERILGSVKLPASRRRWSLRELLLRPQAAPLGMAFAAGMLITLSYYELTGHERPAADLSNMVGSMVSSPSARSGKALDSLAIEAPGVRGQVDLSESGSMFVLSFDVDSASATEIDISLSASGLGFGGIAQSGDAIDMGSRSYEVSDGNLRVASQGRQVFSVFLFPAADGRGSGKNISIGVSTNGERVFDGALRS